MLINFALPKNRDCEPAWRGNPDQDYLRRLTPFGWRSELAPHYQWIRRSL